MPKSSTCIIQPRVQSGNKKVHTFSKSECNYVTGVRTPLRRCRNPAITSWELPPTMCVWVHYMCMYVYMLFWFALIWFYGISTVVGYLMPNPFLYISSSSCRAASTDIPDPLSPLFPIVHRLWQFFRATSRILRRYHGLWGFSEAWLLLIENYSQFIHINSSISNKSV